MKTKQKNELKSTFKRIAIYLAIVFPFVLISTIGLNLLGANSSVLNVFVGVLVGGTLCFVLEVKYIKQQDKLAQQAKTQPKKHDPFAD